VGTGTLARSVEQSYENCFSHHGVNLGFLSSQSRSKLTITEAVTVSWPGAVDGVLALISGTTTLGRPPMIEYPSDC